MKSITFGCDCSAEFGVRILACNCVGYQIMHLEDVVGDFLDVPYANGDQPTHLFSIGFPVENWVGYNVPNASTLVGIIRHWVEGDKFSWHYRQDLKRLEVATPERYFFIKTI